MNEEIMRCPECGGILGATETTDQGRPCTCFGATYKEVAAGTLGKSEESETGDTSVFGQQVVTKQKVCCVCGKDVSGKKRLRDSRGYWCYECHKSDQVANAPKGVRCQDCGRVVAEAALSEFDGKRVCGSCRRDREEAAKRERRFGKVADHHYDAHEKRRTMILGGIFLVLLIIVILNLFHLLPRL